MGFGCSESVGGSRKAVATHGHEAPAAKWCTIIRELTVGWLLVKLLGTQQPAPRVVYSTIRATARINTQCRAQKPLAQKPAINTASRPFPSRCRCKGLCTHSTTALGPVHTPHLWAAPTGGIISLEYVTSEAKKPNILLLKFSSAGPAFLGWSRELVYVLPVVSWWWAPSKLPSKRSFLGLLVYCLQRTT